MFWVSGFPSLFFKSCLAAENPRSDIKRPEDGLKPQAALLGLAKRRCPTAGTGRVTPGWCWVLGQPRTAGAQSGGYGGPRRLPSPPRAAPRHGVFLKILWDYGGVRGPGFPTHPGPTAASPGISRMRGWRWTCQQTKTRKQIPAPGHVKPCLEKCNYYQEKKKKQGKQSLGTAQRWF